MQIVLNDTLTPPLPWEPIPITNWNPDPIRAFHDKVGHLYDAPGGKELTVVNPLKGDYHYPQRGYMEMLSKAYSQHYTLEIAPHDIWYIVLTQIVELIKKSPDSYKVIFTNSDEKKLLVVEKDHATDINMDALLKALKANVPMDTSIFLPELSTHTKESRLAHAAAFADGMRAYYDYGMMCCGLPKINLTGTVKDWAQLIHSIGEISVLFRGIGAPKQSEEYLLRAETYLRMIWGTYAAEGGNVEFWKNIYTQKNVGSGGDLVINGWFGQLWLEYKPGQMIKSFHSTVSSVPYKDFDFEIPKEYVMMFGAFKGVILPENVLQAQYGHMTFEIVDKVPYAERKANPLPNLTVVVEKP